MPLRSVILPVAGQGTRMLPATKSMPKELLPVYDTPLLHFALQEAVAAGAERIVLVSHPEKSAIEDFLRDDLAAIEELMRRGKTTEADALRAMQLPDKVDVRVVYQDAPKGLGHAVLCGAEDILDGPVGVILPDDVLFSGRCLRDMGQAYGVAGCTNLVGAMKVAADQTSKYGIFDCQKTGGATHPARGIVEKPDPENAPSRLAAVGRYVLTPAIFDQLQETAPGAGDEIQLTDAIDAMGGLHAFPIAETRFDCGSKSGLLNASNAYFKLCRADRQTAIAAE
ncbi:UTP--glucose-1-phosphate uridylyltransferase [Marivita sp. S0852]|uniref:UTP--glucose-1-phosphate uridylyltransferase n=1 Tax=Marivita sp. S0852 TaxID=3373893 RepID=UPI003981B41F